MRTVLHGHLGDSLQSGGERFSLQKVIRAMAFPGKGTTATGARRFPVPSSARSSHSPLTRSRSVHAGSPNGHQSQEAKCPGSAVKTEQIPCLSLPLCTHPHPVPLCVWLSQGSGIPASGCACARVSGVPSCCRTLRLSGMEIVLTGKDFPKRCASLC